MLFKIVSYDAKILKNRTVLNLNNTVCIVIWFLVSQCYIYVITRISILILSKDQNSHMCKLEHCASCLLYGCQL